ncbi:MAG TPA: hypothetical protein PKU70_03030, partial [Vicinamibacteria bacterium]|nr:hypothetical protein [Vicinamibacteria bacterium]
MTHRPAFAFTLAVAALATAAAYESPKVFRASDLLTPRVKRSFRPQDAVAAELLTRELGVLPAAARVLTARGYLTVDDA